MQLHENCLGYYLSCNSRVTSACSYRNNKWSVFNYVSDYQIMFPVTGFGGLWLLQLAGFLALVTLSAWG